MSEPADTPGYTTVKTRVVHEYDETSQIPTGEAIGKIQQRLRQYDAETAAKIADGCSFYIGKNRIHSADCPTLKHVLWAEESRFWVEATDDPEVIGWAYEDLFDRWGDRFYIPGELVTRKDAARSVLKRCQTCAPDIPAHIPGKPTKKVAGLGASDLGRLLHGHPIESILYEPGSVTVRTRQAVHRFDITDTVQLESAAAAAEIRAEPDLVEPPPR